MTSIDKSPNGLASSWIAPKSWAVAGYLFMVAQFALLVLLIVRFNLETKAFQDVLLIALGGFLVHHFLPEKWRLTFFLALSVGATSYVLGLDQREWHAGLWLARALPLFTIGLTLIGICHLPLRLGARVALLLSVGLGLAWLRANWAAWPESGGDSWIWPVLGAMFMFRLMIYLHDLQHDKGPVRPIRTLAYFFLLPNVCFTLFPVIDYKTFCRTYYNEEALRIYQRGLGWMTRGITHLLLWRIVYYEFYIDPSRVADGTELVRYAVSNMALYLRISGQFHLVIGLLLLFGFNLPETNRRYFLASGFTDYWRRVNIYWKDFIMKLFYYPAVFYLKAWGPIWSMVTATVFALFVTWLLHSYQTFWVRNAFPVNARDIIFWGTLCGLLVVSSLHEMRKGRARSLGSTTMSLAGNVAMGLRTAGTFLVLSTLWSLWTADSLEQWLELLAMADTGTLSWGLASLAAIFAAALILEGKWRKAPAGGPKLGAPPAGAAAFPVREAMLNCVLPAALLLLVSVKSLHPHLGPGIAGYLGNLFETKPNASDEQAMVRGYYENLMEVERANPMLAMADSAKPRDWAMLEKSEVYRETDDYRMNDLAPSKHIVLNGHPLGTNSWGMRDREYDLAKPAGTYRIAILGSSTVMGLNVDDGEPFEALVEERLNRELSGKPHARYEILNFAVNGYNPPQQVLVLEKKVLDFKPDALVLVVHQRESYFVVQRFAKSLRKGIAPLDEVFRAVAEDAGVDARTPELRAEKRLLAHWPRLVEWAFNRMAEDCRRAGIEPIMVYLPGVTGIGADREEADLMMDMASKAGFITIGLEGVFGDAKPESLMVAPWDAHANALGHRIIADGLFKALTAASGGRAAIIGTPVEN